MRPSSCQNVPLVCLSSLQTSDDLQPSLMKAVWICLHRHHLPRCHHYLLCSKHCPIIHRPLLSSHLVSNKHHTSVQHMLQSDWLPLLQDIMSPFLKCLSHLRIPLWRHGLDLLQLAYHIHFCHSNSSTRSNGLRHIPLPGQVLLLPSGNLLTLRHIRILYSTNNTCLL
ncbi:hypothetical protein PBY51_013187 [Eleginops maclovinus]|uniref:Uncharacterized protein n=1 Tax=Eleginops maclovinus TaxID=56733 RepID=A0AAN7YA64_ELEMC|nr:hypothetical protein PBY51_013187 [Eleginops maclovinus]